MVAHVLVSSNLKSASAGNHDRLTVVLVEREHHRSSNIVAAFFESGEDSYETRNITRIFTGPFWVGGRQTLDSPYQSDAQNRAKTFGIKVNSPCLSNSTFSMKNLVNSGTSFYLFLPTWGQDCAIILKTWVFASDFCGFILLDLLQF